MVFGSQVWSQHFYGGGQQIPLFIDSTKMALKFDETVSPNQQATLLSQIGRIDSTIADEHAVDNFIICALSDSQGTYQFLDSVEAVDGVYATEPYYVNQLDSAFVVGTRFCVAFNEGVSSSQIDSINGEFGVVIDHEIERMPNVFVLRNTDSSGYGLLDVANAYYNLAVTRYSHPEFGIWIQKQEYRLYDYYSNYQAHTKKVIGAFNSASVWDFGGLTADMITVAVIDDGVESHEDLPGSRIHPGVDYADQDNDASPGPARGHGMSCAGIIASSHTTDSVTGLSTESGVISLTGC